MVPTSKVVAGGSVTGGTAAASAASCETGASLATPGPALSREQYTVYSHRGQSPFNMVVPRQVPWHGGVIVFPDDNMYDRECRCGLVKYAQFYPHGTHARGGSQQQQPVVVALKILDRARVAAEADEWEKEVSVMMKLQPRGLAGVERACRQIGLWDYRAVEGEPNVYIATEWAAGGTLQSWAMRHVRALRDASNFPLWFERVLPRLAHQLFTGLAHIHAAGDHGVAHLDLDPVNIVMTSPDLLTAEVRFIDFGSARAADSMGEVGDDGIKWKFHYCAPELHQFWARQLDRFKGAEADMFSAAAVLWWLIALPPACLFQDTSSRTMVDQRKDWLVNLRRHAEGLHKDEAEARAKAALCAARDALSAALARAGQLKAAKASAERALLAASARRSSARTLPEQQVAHQHVEAATAQYSHLASQLASAEQEVRVRHLCHTEMAAGRRVVQPFVEGECLCCRWGFNIPPQWRTLLVYVLLRDRTPASQVLLQLQRDILKPLGIGSGSGSRAGAGRGTVTTRSTAGGAPPAVAAVPSTGALPRQVAEAALSDDDGPPRKAGAGAGAGAAIPPPPPLERQMSLELSDGLSIGGGLGLGVSGDAAAMHAAAVSGASLGQELCDAAAAAAGGGGGGGRSKPFGRGRGVRGVRGVRGRPRYKAVRDAMGRAVPKHDGHVDDLPARNTATKRGAPEGASAGAGAGAGAGYQHRSHASRPVRSVSLADSVEDLSTGAFSVASAAGSVRSSSASVVSAWSAVPGATLHTVPSELAAGHVPQAVPIRRLSSDTSMLADTA